MVVCTCVQEMCDLQFGQSILFVVFSSQLAQWRSSDQEFGQRAYWTEDCSVRLEQPQEKNEGVA